MVIPGTNVSFVKTIYNFFSVFAKIRGRYMPVHCKGLKVKR